MVIQKFNSVDFEKRRGGFKLPILERNIMTRVVHCKKESYDVYIGRPSIYGNPFSHLPDTPAKFRVASREEAIAKFEKWFRNQPELIARAKRELRGKTLGCWCFPKPCHGNILAKIVDEKEI